MKPQCQAAVEQAIGRALKDNEVREIERRISTHARELKNMNRQQLLGMTPDQRMAHVATLAAKGYLADVALRNRRKVMSAQKIATIKAMIDADPVAGIDRLRDLVTFNSDSGGQSIESNARAIATTARGEIFDSIQIGSGRFLGYLADADKQKKLLQELMGEASGDPDAAAAAKAFRDMAEGLRQRFNRAGGNVGKLDDWGIPHHHSQYKIASYGRDAWVDHIMPLLNRDRYFNDDGTQMNDADLRVMLKEVWSTIATDGASKDIQSGSARGLSAGSTANHGSASRSIHFKDAESLTKYWDMFGEKGLLEIMLGHIDGMSKDIAAVELFGPNAENNFRQLLNHSETAYKNARGLKGRAVTSLGKKKGQIDVEFKYATGQTPGIEYRALHNMFAGIRSFNVATGLGSAMLTSITDQGMMALTSVYNKGTAINAAAWEAKLLADSGKREFASRQGLMLQTMINDLSRFAAFGEVGSAGRVAPGLQGAERAKAQAGRAVELGAEYFSRANRELANVVMKASLLPQLTDIRRAGFSMGMMDSLGGWSRKPFASLDAEMQGYMKGVGITPEMFDIWNAARVEDFGGGHTVLTSSEIMRVSDSEIARVIGNNDPDAIIAAREQAATNLTRLVQDESFMAVLEPSIRTRAMLFGFTDPTSVGGFLRRSGFQYMSFPIAFTFQHLGRVIHKMQRDGKWSGALYGAGLVTATTALGGMAIMMNDVASGRDPSDMTHPSFAMRAFLKGGGAGIYGDLLLAGQTAQGKSAGELLLGPTYGRIIEPVNIGAAEFESILSGEPSDKGAKFVRWQKTFMPGQNLWWSKAATDHLIWNDMMEEASPGYLYRQQRRMKNMYGNESYWPADEPMPVRAPNLSAAVGGE